MLRSVGGVKLVGMKFSSSQSRSCSFGDRAGKFCGGRQQRLGGRRITGVSGNLEVSILVLSAVEASVLGRRSIGCLERLREGVGL